MNEVDELNLIWKIEGDRYYWPHKQRFVTDTAGGVIVPLYIYMPNGDRVLADVAKLRSLVLERGYPLGEEIKNRLDKIQDVLAEFDPQLQRLRNAKLSADMLADSETEQAVSVEYQALITEMQARLREVPLD